MCNFLRKFCTLVLAISIASLSGCNPPQFSQAPKSNSGQEANGQTYPNGQVQPTTPTAYQPQSTIKVGSFNIQSFGNTKMSRPVVMEYLVDIVKRHDILAIQELRDIDQRVIPQFLEMINKGGGQYAAAVGPRQGYIVEGKKTTYFEQTVYIYDITKVELLSQPYAAYDPTQVMHRPPFVGHFRCLNAPLQQAFTFVLMNVHVAPENVGPEFQALEQIIPGIRQSHGAEDDFILLGDLNAEVQEMKDFNWLPKKFAAIPPQWKTKTTEKRSIDNIVFDPNNTIEFVNSGVINLMNEYSISQTEAELISDHMPVWATFSTFESAPATVTLGPQGVRR
ncbi:MAG: endonuclease/exonuclease/phosphatase family protein [Mariniblastus sp.]